MAERREGLRIFPTMQVIGGGVAVLLASGPLGILACRRPAGHRTTYVISLVASALIALAAAGWLLGPGTAEPTATLPLGLPWLQAHFRVDALSGYFLVVVNLLAAIIALYAIGYGAHEEEP
jgi:hydrogenase-4 component B